MPVDKLGRNGDRTTPVYTGINIANLTNSFLRRDGGKFATGALNMNSHIIKNVVDPLSNQDVATKIYVDKKAITTAGGVVSGDIELNVGSDFVRSLDVTILLQVRRLHFCWGHSQIRYRIPHPIQDYQCLSKTDAGCAIFIHQLPICDFG